MNNACTMVLEELRGLFHQSPRPKVERKLEMLESLRGSVGSGS